ncbi:MAG: porin family protein [Colwellia sp.]|nr:porin family protein [Colwellia sp.]
MKNALFLVPLTLPLMFMLTAQAANENDFYMGVQYSNQKISSSSDINLDSAGIVLGYQLNQYLAFETRLNIGTSEYSSLCACGDEYKEHVYKQKVDNQASLFVKGEYPISNDFSVYALAGITNSSYSLETKNNYTIVEGNSSVTSLMFTDTGKHSESGFTYGIGINYQLSKKISAFFDYQVLPDLAVKTLDSSSWKSANIGINYTF